MGREEVDSSMHLLYQLKGLHVLLVDYDPVSLSKSTILLREASFKVTHTKIQQVALTLLQECKGQFKAVVTSDQKQDMDCHSFIQRMRTIQQAIPIVVVSSSESSADPGMKTLFDTACYVINKPVTKNALERVLQWHMMRLSVQVRRNDLKGKDKANDISAVNPSGDVVGRQTTRKGDQREDNRGLQLEKTRKPKRSKPYEKKVRPTFDPEQHKKLMAAICYHGPTKHIGMSHFIPRREPYLRFPLRSQEQQLPAATAIAERCDREKKMKEAFSGTPRAPWTQQLYHKYRQALSTNKAQGMKGYRYGQPPSWMSPQAWKNRLNSELLGNNSNTSHVAMGPFPMSINPNMESVNRLNDSVVNGMAQNMNTGTLTNPVILDQGNTSNAVAFSNDILNGFFDGVEDEMSFGNINKATYKPYSLQTEPALLEPDNMMTTVQITGFNDTNTGYTSNEITGFSPLYSPLNVDMPDLVVMGQQQLSSAMDDDDDSVYAVVGSGFQSPNHVFPHTNQAQMGAYTATNTEVEQASFQPDHVPAWIDTFPKNQVGTSANGSTKQASEGDVDEFADLFTFLDTHEDGTKEVNADKGIAEVEENNSYFDIDSFDFY